MASSTTPTTSLAAEYEGVDYILDADSHTTEDLETLYPYMDDRYAGIRDNIFKRVEMHTNEIFSLTFPTPVFLHAKGERGLNTGFGGATTAEGKLSMMDEHGIDMSVLDPTLLNQINTVNNSRYAVAIANAYNSYVIEEFADADERLKTTIIVAPHRPDLAAEEIDDRADEDDVVGVNLPPIGLIPPPGHRQYDPIYEAAQDNDLPVTMHTVTGGTHLAYPVQHAWSETYALEHATIHPTTHMFNLSSIVFDGVLSRFSDLDIVFEESGLGWIPYMIWRLDDHYLELSYELPDLEQLPSDYIREQCYFTSQPLGHTADDGSHIARIIEMIGPDRVMYSADIPHPDFDPPDELFARIRSSFDDETLSAIMGGTAADVFGIEI